MIIGKYTLEWRDGKLYISNPDGEAGEFSSVKLEKALDKFWKKEF